MHAQSRQYAATTYVVYNLICALKVEYIYTVATRVSDYVLYYIDTIPMEANMCLFGCTAFAGEVPQFSLGESNVEWVIET